MAFRDDGVSPLSPEAVASWYFRLNGFLQFQNFIVHPVGGGGQRTDGDVIGVRFPARAERLFDPPHTPMDDDNASLDLSETLVDVVIVEVTRERYCKLNGPWTTPEKRNVHRVLAAIGCLPHERIKEAAQALYTTGHHIAQNGYRIRLVALGCHPDADLSARYPDVVQLSWARTLTFIWERFDHYSRQKSQVDQWDTTGQTLKGMADRAREPERFVREVASRMQISDTNVGQDKSQGPAF